MATVKSYLATEFPKLPDEVSDYISAVLEDNKDEMTCAEEILEFVKDHIQSAVDNTSDERVDKCSGQLLKLLHGDRVVSKKQVATARRLEQAVDMGAQVHNFSQLDSIWKIQSRDTPTNTDKKKLGKAIERTKAKMEQREAEQAAENATGTRRQKKNEPAATVSQAVSRRGNDAASQNSLDIHIESIDMAIGNKQLLSSADLHLIYGRRYGLVGRNGIGKTTLLKMIASGQLIIPSNIRMLSVEQEVEGDDTRVIDAVLASDKKREQLLQKEQTLQAKINDPSTSEESRANFSDQLSKLYAEMEAAQMDKAPARASSILYGLGFSPDEQKKPTREFSGGWRMRVALARALFVKPDLLLLDEPTNMLDMRAVYWLEGHLQEWIGTIVTVSHDRKFLNFVCNDIIHLHTRRLDAYRGDYETFEKTMKDKLLQQQREYEAQQQLRAHTQEFIDKFRYNAKRASMVQSRIKMLEKLPVLLPVELESEIHFTFPACERLDASVLQLDNVSFRYNEESTWLFKKLDVGSHADSRICIVGENGAGKTTLLKLLLGDISPTTGLRNANRRLRIGYFTQHHVDQLEMTQTALEVIAAKVPGKTQEEYRQALSRFGLTGDAALQPVDTLSGGQKSRLAFANLAVANPNYLIMDEPSNHLDVETVEALGRALRTFNGGVVLVTHDERLIELVCTELWVVKDRMVTRLDGGLEEYRKQVHKQLQIIG